MIEKSLDHLLNHSRMALLVSLPENKLNLAKAAIEEGADGIKFHINVAHYASGNNFNHFEDYVEIFTEVRNTFDGPMGIVIGDDADQISQSEVENIIACGFDYFSLYLHHVPSFLVQEDRLTKTVALSGECHLALRSQLKHLPLFDVKGLELSVIPPQHYRKVLTLEDLLVYQSMIEATDIPTIVPSQKSLSPMDISLLDQIGVKAVMLGAVVTGTDETSIRRTICKFRNAIDQL